MANKIKEFISDLMRKVRSLMSRFFPDSTEGKLVSEMNDALEELYSMWVDALTDAGRAYKSGSELQVSASKERIYQERNYNYEELISKEGMIVCPLQEINNNVVEIYREDTVQFGKDMVNNARKKMHYLNTTIK